MYIWIGINVDEQLENVKISAKKVEKQINFKHSTFTLPLHISLKISFYIDDKQLEMVISDIVNVLKDIKPFNINILGIELEHNICWIKMMANEKLNQIHNLLDNMLLEKYNVPLHKYDLNYIFHTTLFMDNDELKVKEAFSLMKNYDVPKILKVNKFLIGVSPNGYLETYKVIREISN